MHITLTQIGDSPAVVIDIKGVGRLSPLLIDQLTNALGQAEDLGSTSLMVIHVIGEAGSGTLPKWPGDVEMQLVSKWERTLRRIERLHMPTVALVEHTCSALALELLLVTDRRFASRNLLLRHTAPDNEIWPGMALYRLCRQIGQARAHTILLDAAEVSAAQAAELNLIDGIVEDFPSGLARLTDFLRRAPLSDFAVRRRLIQDSFFTSFDDALGSHLAACDRALRRSQVKP